MPDAFDDSMRELRELFLSAARERLTRIDDALGVVERAPLDRDALDALRLELHRLGGVAGSYGFENVSALVQAAERECDALLISGAAPTPEQIARWRASVDQLRPVGRVLAVDDDPVVRQLVQVSLERVAGWRVEVASSGAQALEKAAGAGYDLMLLDSLMPEMDGAATLAALRRAGHVAPVIFLTGKADAEAAERYVALGAAGVVRKPFNPRSLADEIRRLLVRKTLVGGR